MSAASDSGAALEFGVATASDVPALVALVTSAYRGQASRAGWTTEADLLDGERIDAGVLLADIERPRSLVLLAWQPGATAADVAAAGTSPAADVAAAGTFPAAASAAGAATNLRRLVACAHVAQDGDAGSFGMFAVDPTAQGGGIGKQLLARAERVAAVDWQLPVMRMQVIDVRGELIAFYERRGYRRTGVHKPFPYGDARFGVPRRDDLRFETLEKVLGP